MARRSYYNTKRKILREIMDSVHKAPVIKFKERRLEVVLHRLRIGHVGLKQYKYRFNMATNEECEICKITESVEHYMLNCKKHEASREILKKELEENEIKQLNIKTLLGGGNFSKKVNSKVLQATMKYIKATKMIDEL